MTIERDEFLKWLRLNSRSFDINYSVAPYSLTELHTVTVTLDLPELIVINGN